MIGKLKYFLKGFYNQGVFALHRGIGMGVKPRFLSYAVTWRCNSKCIMCDTWKMRETPDELSVQELDFILGRDRSYLKTLMKVGITGGEPFLRKDLVDVVRVFRTRLPQAKISIVSNGFLTHLILERLKEIRSFYPEIGFSVSLDGLGCMHDKVRGIPGGFEMSMATLQGALQLGIPATSGMTVSPINLKNIEPLAELLTKMGVDFSFNLPEKGLNFHNAGKTPAFNEEEIGELIRVLKPFSNHFYMDNLSGLLKGKKRRLPCYSGIVSYFLKPNGELAMCNIVEETLGNLREQKLQRIIRGSKAREIRMKHKKCSCWSQCEVKYSAASAPLHQLLWFLKHKEKKKILARYASRLFPAKAE